MASGTAAELADGTRLGAPQWLAVAVADRPAGSPSARVRLAAVIDEDTARTAAAPLLTETDEVTWTDGDVTAHHAARLGAITLTTRPLAHPDPAQLRTALLDGLRREGPGLLRWTRDADTLRLRLAFLHREIGAPWPDVSDEALISRADEWLAPELATARRRADLARADAATALGRLLPWATGEAARLDELAPERLEIPSGSRIRVSYDDDRPVLAAKLQELFGWTATPASPAVASPSSSTCSHPPAAPPPSPPTSHPSGATATARCARNSAAATPSTPGPRTPRRRSPPGTPAPGSMLRTDEEVHERDGLPSGDGDVVRIVAAPGDPPLHPDLV